MIRHPLGQHTPECSNPTNCFEYALVMDMTATEHANYINHSTARFAELRAASSRQFRTSEQEDFTPPHGYALTAAQQREHDTQEARYKAARLRELDAEHAEMFVHLAAKPGPRLTAAELAEFEPPNPYPSLKVKR